MMHRNNACQTPEPDEREMSEIDEAEGEGREKFSIFSG